MANEIIRPTQIPARADPVASEVVPSDNGATVGGVTWADGVNAAVPPASQAEAEAGVINTKRMTPLTTKQAIDAQVPPKISAAIGALNLGTASQAQAGDFATAVQGAKADSAVQSVVAGENVEIDDTDPLNPVISIDPGAIIPPDGSVTLPKLAPGVLDFGNISGDLPSSVLADQEEAEEGSDNLKAMTPLRTLQAVREGGFIPKNLFGLRDSLANQSGALQAAVNGIAEETVLRGTGRGAVLNIEGWTGRIDDDITLPRHVRVGGLRPVPAVYYGEMIDEWQPAIELASTATIRQETGSGLHNMTIRRQGLITYGGDGVTEVGKFAGTAISIPNNTGDQRNQGLTILGFNRAVDTLDPVGGDTALISRPFFQDIYIDCINGIRIKNAYDIPKLFSIHGNPWVTEQLSGLAADKHFRNGTFISLEGVNDWAHLWDCFSYAWLRGFDINGADDVRMFACGADHLPERVDDGSIGLLVQGNVFDLIVQGYVSAAKQTSMYLNSFDPDARYMVSGFATHAFDQNAIVLERGKLALSQSSLRGPGGGSGIGIQVLSTAERLTVSDTVTFEELGIGILGHADVPQLVSPRANFKNVATRHSGRHVPSVASASVMTIPSDFNFISVTGSVGVGTMLSENVEEGRIIEIQAVHGVTVFDTVAATANTFRLGSDIILSAGDLLRVTRDINGQWRKAT